MINHYHYSDDERKALLQSLTVLVDTREQENNHITNYFARSNIAHISRKLDFGDYSFFLPANAGLGIQRDIYFTGSITIERKNSLEELSGNTPADQGKRETAWAGG